VVSNDDKMQRVVHDRHQAIALGRALEPNGLSAVYQPIVRLDTLSISGYEGLTRLRSPMPGVSPATLFAVASEAGCLAALELRAVQTIIGSFRSPVLGPRLWMNFSAQALLELGERPDPILAAMRASGQPLSRFVIEFSERDVTTETAALAQVVGYLRAAGVRIALDDFGSGHSNFKMWNGLHPEYVKLDHYLVHGIAESPERLVIVRALKEVAEGLGAKLIAEGVERSADLLLLRDLGINYAQGFLLARPAAEPQAGFSEAAHAALASDEIPVRPAGGRRAVARTLTASALLTTAPYVAPTCTSETLFQLFRENPDLHAVAVVEDRRPVGVINRRSFVDRYALPYYPELFGKRPCTRFMNDAPVLCDESEPIDNLAEILKGEDQRYLADGIVITRNGHYLGLATGEALVRRVTERRIEAARYANPLTFLPGNVPVSEHIERLLGARREFVAAYCDLNHFKPFNDLYGYFRGDEMIRLVAQTLMRHIDPLVDFVGHIGGDDFIVVFQSADWNLRARRMVEEFNERSRGLFDASDVARGGLEAEDRQGHRAFFPLTTLAVGTVSVPAASPMSAEEVASAAAAAKRRAKQTGSGVLIGGEPARNAAAPSRRDAAVKAG
jgi:diguanylate cyclase (GGDEF)-like protein